MADDRNRWDERYRGVSKLNNVNQLLVESTDLLPRTGTALDIAGGSGADSLFLAERGLRATLLDVSPVALEMATAAGTERNIELWTVAADTETDELPDGPWDVIHIAHYLHRPTIQAAASRLAPGGLLVISIATQTNLERRPRPPAAFLLERGELPNLIGDLQVVRFDEEWRANDVHEAWLVAQAS